MSYFDHVDYKLFVLYLIEDPVVALPYSIFFLPGKLLTPDRVRVFGKTPDFIDDANSIFLFDPFDFLRGRLLDDDPIAFHFFSGMLRTFRNQSLVHFPFL